MEKPEINIEESIKGLRKHSDEIFKVTSFYEKRISELQEHIVRAQRVSREAEQKAKLAEEKYQKALSLKGGQYESLIRDIFETPREKLESSIKTQSKTTNIVTAGVAILSIVISILVTSLSQMDTNNLIEWIKHDISKIKGFQKNNEEKFNAIQETKENVKIVAETTWRSDKNLRSLVEKILSVKENFNNYSNKFAVARMYLHRLLGHDGHHRYSDYIMAMKFANISTQSLPTNASELKLWEEEMILVLNEGIEIMTKKGLNKVIPPGHYKYRDFKIQNAIVDQGAWGYTIDKDNSTTYEVFVGWLKNKKKKMNDSIVFNANFKDTNNN